MSQTFKHGLGCTVCPFVVLVKSRYNKMKKKSLNCLIKICYAMLIASYQAQI